MGWEYPDSHDLNFSNRPVRTRMPGGVAGAQSMTAPYANHVRTQRDFAAIAVRS